ncbi:hypothetical protein ERJ75_001694500 [Trypanosoma vivax]|nr:hypothetical protein ERJ75_001694500 [Trypanosoma vivax]
MWAFADGNESRIVTEPMKYNSSTNVYRAKHVPSLLSDFAALDKTAAKDNIASAIRIENSRYDELNSVTYNFTVKAEVLLETHEWANFGRDSARSEWNMRGSEESWPRMHEVRGIKEAAAAEGRNKHAAQSGITHSALLKMRKTSWRRSTRMDVRAFLGTASKTDRAASRAHKTECVW